MSDLISRQAAIDIVRFECGEWEGLAKTIIKRFEQLPSAQPEQQWIPCSERLPEDEQPILFSTTTGRVHQGRFHRDNSVNRWYSSLDKMRAYNNVVNAWMPLPEPYKEDDHD